MAVFSRDGAADRAVELCANKKCAAIRNPRKEREQSLHEDLGDERA
jgi:hypothetical protein